MSCPEGFTELRFNVPNTLMVKIDAIQNGAGIPSRGECVLPWLETGVAVEVHKATVLLRCLHINPLQAESERK